MISHSVILILVSYLTRCDSCSPVECPADVTVLPTNKTFDKLYLLAVLPLHKQGENPYTCTEDIESVFVFRLHAFEWAINTVRRRLTGVPDIKFGAVIVDSCNSNYNSIETIAGVEMCRTSIKNENNTINKTQVIAYVDFHSDAFYGTGNRLTSLENFGKPVFRLNPQHSDNNHGFYKSGPVVQQLKGLIEIITSTSNTEHYTMVLYSNTEFYTGLYETFADAAENVSLCIAYNAKVDQNEDLRGLISIIQENNNYRFLVLLLEENTLIDLLKVMENDQNADSVIYSITVLIPDLYPTLPQIQEKSTLTSVTLRYTTRYNNTYINDIDEFIQNYQYKQPFVSNSNRYFNELWRQKYACSTVDDCPVNANFSSEDLLINVEDIFVMTDILIAGISEAVDNICDGKTSCDITQPSNTDTIRRYLQNSSPYGSILITDNHMSAIYSVIERRPGQAAIYKKVGIVDEIGNFISANGGIRAYDKNGRSSDAKSSCVGSQLFCKSLCSILETTTTMSTNPSPNVIQCTNISFNGNLPEGFELNGGAVTHVRASDTYGDRQTVYGHTWIFALGVCIGISILVVIAIEILIIVTVIKETRKKEVVLKYRTVMLGQLLLFGIIISYVTLIAFMFVPDALSCGVVRFCVGFSYAFMFSALIVKLLVLLTSLSADSNYLPDDERSINYLKGTLQVIIFLAALAVQVAIGVQWLIRVTPGASFVLSYGKEYIWTCNHYTWLVGNSHCDMAAFVRSSNTNHIISLVYVSFLLLVSLILASMSQNIITNLKESRYILFALIFTTPIWIAWQLVAGLVHDYKADYAHEIADASTAFGLYIIATIILLTMFLLRNRQRINAGLESVYLEDDKDTRVFTPSFIEPGYHITAVDNRSFVMDDGEISQYKPVFMETSYSLPRDAMAHDKSAYSTINSKRDPFSDTSTLSRPYATSTLTRDRDGDSIIRETESQYHNDPYALRATHPRSSKGNILPYNASFRSTGQYATSTLQSNKSTRSDRSAKSNKSAKSTRSTRSAGTALHLSHNLTGRRQAHATVYPSYVSEIGSMKSRSKQNKMKRSKSYEGLMAGL